MNTAYCFPRTIKRAMNQLMLLLLLPILASLTRRLSSSFNLGASVFPSHICIITETELQQKIDSQILRLDSLIYLMRLEREERKRNPL